MPNTSPFYPSVSNLVSASNFPAQLQFLQNGLQTVLNNMFYKDLQFERSPDGSQAFYNITLVTGEVLKIDLFNSDFSVILNPGSSQDKGKPDFSQTETKELLNIVKQAITRGVNAL